MSIEPKHENDTKNDVRTGILNWPSAIMLALWLLVILAFSGLSPFGVLGSPIVLGIILLAAVVVTAWSAYRFFKTSGKNS